MKILLFFIFFANNLFLNITFEELDFIRSLSDKHSNSIIENGTIFCNDHFDKNFPLIEYKYENYFMCKFSKKRNRFYIYMLAVEKKVNTPLKEFCKDILFSWPEIYDHLDLKLKFQRKDYLSGFYVENFFNDKVLNFKNEFSIDQRIINNEINNFIIGNRDKFSNNNLENNSIVQDQVNKIDKIYKKIISQTESNLDKIIKDSLYKIVRYKIFVNDIKKFQSFSCNWKPGRGIEPYVKKEKFSEFENI